MVSRTVIYAAIAIVIVAVGSSVGTYYLTLPPPPREYDKVIFSLPWLASGSYSPFYVGLDKGYYEDEGIIITIQRGYGSSDAAIKTGTRQVDFALSGFDALISVVNQGAEIKAVGLYAEKTHAGISIVESSGIKVPKDMEGHTFATTTGALGLVLFPAFAEKYGIDQSKITIITMDPASVYVAMQSGTVDGAITAVYEAGIVSYLGTPCVAWSYSDFGLPVLGACVVTSDVLTEENPDLVRRFLRATYRSIEDTINDPEGAIQIITKYVPELDAGTELVRLKDITMELMSPQIDAGLKGTDFGFMDPSIVDSSNVIVSQALGISKIPNDQLYTNEFLD